MDGTTPRVWSTDQVRPQDRLAYWLEVVCRTLVSVECVARQNPAFFGQIESHAVGPIRISVVRSSPQIASRQPRTIAQNPRDEFALHVHRLGSSALTQLGREAVLRPGDMALHDMSRPFDFNFATDWVETAVLFPREALLGRVGNVDRYIGGRIDSSAGVAAMLSPLLAGLPRQLDRIPEHARGRLADNLLDLIATALLAGSEQPFESSTATLTRIKLWIERHLGEALSAESIATQCGLSSRHLNRLFAGENTSLMRFVLERRLARCHRDLSDPALSGRPITDIALAAGFNDLSHFSRTYRTRYGCAPRETQLLALSRTDAKSGSATASPACISQHIVPAASTSNGTLF